MLLAEASVVRKETDFGPFELELMRVFIATS